MKCIKTKKEITQCFYLKIPLNLKNSLRPLNRIPNFRPNMKHHTKRFLRKRWINWLRTSQRFLLTMKISLFIKGSSKKQCLNSSSSLKYTTRSRPSETWMTLCSRIHMGRGPARLETLPSRCRDSRLLQKKITLAIFNQPIHS